MSSNFGMQCFLDNIRATPDIAINFFAYFPDTIREKVLVIPRNATMDVDNQNAQAFPPLATLGGLDVFPTELLNAMVQYSDLQSVATLRLVNRQARLVVDASVPYQYLIRYIPQVVAAFMKTGIASHFTVDRLYQVLCRSSCALCGQFGALLWMPECRRCCLNCFRDSPFLLTLSESDARVFYGLTKRAFVNVPSVLSLPGTYAPERIIQRRRLRLYSGKEIWEAAVRVHGGEDALEHWIQQDTSVERSEYNRRVARRVARRPTFYSACRSMATTPLPYLDPVSRTLCDGFACRGCMLPLIRLRQQPMASAQLMPFLHRQSRMYDKEEFVEHVKRCHEAYQMWVARQLRAA